MHVEETLETGAPKICCCVSRGQCIHYICKKQAVSIWLLKSELHMLEEGIGVHLSVNLRS